MKFLSDLEAKIATAQIPSVPAPSIIAAQKTRAAQVEIDIAMQIIVDDGSVLSKEISQFDDWADATDNEIEVAMQKFDNWKKKMEKLRQKSFDIQRNTISFNLGDAKMRSSMSMVNALSSELDTVLDRIQFEDKARCLYSLKDDEDFSKFEEEAKKAKLASLGEMPNVIM